MEKAQSAQCLPCKFKEMNLVSSAHVRKQKLEQGCDALVPSELGTLRQMEFGVCWLSSLVYLMWSKSRRDAVSKKWIVFRNNN